MFDERYCNTYAMLFTPSFLEKVIADRHVGFIVSLLRNSKAQISPSLRLGTLFDAIYEKLESVYRCEYIYKNTIARELLLTKHTLDEACLFTEFTASGSKADVVIVNGTTTAYEVKTELDSLIRIQSQVASYQRVFEYVNIVTHEALIPKVELLFDSSVGIMMLSEDGKLIEKRKANSNLADLSLADVFDCLRSGEYIRVIREELGVQPDVPNTRRYTTYKELFGSLSPDVAHRQFLKSLQARSRLTQLSNFIGNAPRSLSLLHITAKLSVQEFRLLHTKLGAEIPLS
jgi:hypothetical protein